MIHERIKLEMPGSEIYANVVAYVISHSEEIGIDKRPLVIVCPGGGYCFTSEREAEMFALKWNAYGYHAMVLWYSVRPAVYPAALLELTMGNAGENIEPSCQGWFELAYRWTQEMIKADK